MKNTESPAIAGKLDKASEQETMKRAFDLCVRKTRGNIKRLADEPKSAPWAVDGNYFGHPEGFYEIGNWTSSFFTGMALFAWRETEDEYFLQQVLRLAPHYREKVFTRFMDTHHDLGFLYLALFRRALQADGRQAAPRSRPARRRGVCLSASMKKAISSARGAA